MAEDELEAIQAIYCREGELTISHDPGGGHQISVQLSTSSDDSDGNRSPPLTAELRLMLPASYPNDPPIISVLSNHLTRDDQSEIRTSVSEYAQQNAGQPVLMDIISLASEELHKIQTKIDKLRSKNECKDKQDEMNFDQKTFSPRFLEKSGETHFSPKSGDRTDCVQNTGRPSGGHDGSRNRIALLHLDHMRAKGQYVKLIKKWTSELALGGRLIFCQRLILILLQGTSDGIKEYIVRQRTSNVDVDSRGQPCKERMLSALWEGPTDAAHVRFPDFETVEMETAADVQSFFKDSGMTSLFENHVKNLKHFPVK